MNNTLTPLFRSLPVGFGLICAFAIAEEIVDLEPIVVNRTERVVRTEPVAIDLLDERDLSLTKTESLRDLQRLVPTLSFGPAGLDAKISLRGIRNSSELVTMGADGALAVHMDQVFLARSHSARMDLFDIAGVELLRGPQSTLYGRNSLAGSMNIITRKPTAEPEGYVTIGAGSYDRMFGSAAVSGPLIEDKLLGRLALYGNVRDGYGDNDFDGSDYEDDETTAGRLSLSYIPSEDMDAHFSAHVQRKDNKNAVYSEGTAHGGPVLAQLPPLNGSVATEHRHVNQNTPSADEREFSGATLTVNNRLNNETAVKNLTSWQKMDLKNIVDTDDTEITQLDFYDEQKAEQFSHDVHWYSTKEDASALEWIVGLTFFYERMEESARVDNPFGPAPIPVIMADAEIETYSYAAWFELRKELAPGLRGQIGARYNYDEKSFEETATTLGPRKNDLKDSWDDIPVKAALSYDLTENVVTYGSVATGFKSGSYNINQGPASKAYDPEKVVTYETGLKATSDDRKLRGNLGYFFSDYQDLQIAFLEAAAVKVINASDASIHGIEADLEWAPCNSFRFLAAGAWLDATFDSLQQVNITQPQLGMQDLSGNRLPQAPEFAFHLGTEIDFLGDDAERDLVLRVDYSWQDEVYYDQFNRDNVGEGSFGLLDASLTHFQGDWEISVFARNLTDEKAAGNALVSSSLAGFPVRKFYVAPARYGASVTRHF